MEVRYEALRSNGPAMIGELLEFCGLASEPHMIKTLIGQNAMGASRGMGSIVFGGEMDHAPTEEAEGFFGSGGTGDWGKSWSPSDRWEFDHVAGDLLVELGYEPDRSWSQLPARAARVRHGTAAAREFRDRGFRRAGQLLMERGRRSMSSW